MPELLRQFATLTEPVTSPSGEWALRYDDDGRAEIGDRHGRTIWAAGAVGTLRLEQESVFAVYQGDQVVWRDLPGLEYSSISVTDDGDGVVYCEGLPKYSLRHGPIEPVSLGDRAPVAEIHGSRFIESGNGKRVVHRTADGSGLICKTSFGLGTGTIDVVQPDEVRALDQPGTWLTWRFDDSGYGAWSLVLVGPDGGIRWEHGKGHADENGDFPEAEPPDLGEAGDGPDWLVALRAESAYCVTVIHDIDPDEALRRFGARDDEISTATWTQLWRRVNYEESFMDYLVVAAFALGPHTLLVEDNGYEAVDRPDLSLGTFAVSSYCSINADHRFLVSRDGKPLASFVDFIASDVEGTEPDVLTEALARMGIDDIEEFDSDDDNFLDDLELLCHLTGVWPEVADVTGPAKVAVLHRDLRRRLPAGATP